MQEGTEDGSVGYSSNHARAHTAEHIFARALQKITGQGIQIMKVEHADDVNRVYIRCRDLDREDVLQAMLLTNGIIDEGRVVREHRFPSLDEARKAFPDMRAYEARISGGVRVVEIDGYDYSACIREHVSNTRECGFFILKGISRESGMIKVEYLVGDEAKKYAMRSVARLAGIASMLKANVNTLEDTLKNMLEELDMLRAMAKRVTEDAVNSLSITRINDLHLYYGHFHMLDDDTLIRRAGMMVKGCTDNRVVVFLNGRKDGASVTLASNDPRLDCSILLREMLARYGGKGGGKAGFATGYITTADTDKDIIREEVMGLIERSLSTK